MQALIFAAGLGTRLFPLTKDRPKALVELAGKSLLCHAIERLKRVGVERFIVNIHHFGDQIISHLEENDNFGVEVVISDERSELLDTGGGLKQASSILREYDNSEPIILYNVDIISSVDFGELVKVHKRDGSLATMVIRNRVGARGLLLDSNRRLVGWANSDTGERIMSRDSSDYSKFGYSGIQIIDSRLLDLIDMDGCFSIIPLYLNLAKKHEIGGYEDRSDLWMDLGRVEAIAEAELMVDRGEITL